EVSISSGECATGVDAIARSDVGHVRTDRLHNASSVRPRREGKRGSARAVVARACVRVIRIHTDRAHANQYFLRIVPQTLLFLQLEYLRASKRVYANPPHGTYSLDRQAHRADRYRRDMTANINPDRALRSADADVQ